MFGGERLRAPYEENYFLTFCSYGKYVENKASVFTSFQHVLCSLFYLDLVYKIELDLHCLFFTLAELLKFEMLAIKQLLFNDRLFFFFKYKLRIISRYLLLSGFMFRRIGKNYDSSTVNSNWCLQTPKTVLIFLWSLQIFNFKWQSVCILFQKMLIRMSLVSVSCFL